MEQRPMTDRAASGDEQGQPSASPQIAVFNESGPPGINAGPVIDRPDPSNHDIYRRPANAIPFRRPPAAQPEEPSSAAPSEDLGSGFAGISDSAISEPAPSDDPGHTASPDSAFADSGFDGSGFDGGRQDPAGAFADAGGNAPVAAVRSADDLPNTGEYPVISNYWPAEHADETVAPAAEQEPYPPFTLVDDLFFDDKGPDLPTQVHRLPAEAAMSAAATAAQPAVAGGPPPGRKRGRLLGLRRGSLLAVLLVAALAMSGVAIAVYAAGSDPLRNAASRTGSSGARGGAAGPAAGAPANPGPAAGAEAAPGEPAPDVAAEEAAPQNAPDPAAAHSVSAPRNGRDKASFDLVNGTTTVRLRAGDLGDDLFRVATPPGSDILPRPVEEGDRVQLHLVDSGEDGPGSVEITLNSQVRWTLRITGGAAEHVIDMSAGELTGLEILGGATRVELDLPEPDGTVPVKMTGGVNEFIVGTPRGTPVRLRIGSGAAQVVLNGKTHRGIAPGKVFVPARWGHADDRIELDAVAGVGTLTLKHH